MICKTIRAGAVGSEEDAAKGWVGAFLIRANGNIADWVEWQMLIGDDEVCCGCCVCICVCGWLLLLIEWITIKTTETVRTTTTLWCCSPHSQSLSSFADKGCFLEFWPGCENDECAEANERTVGRGWERCGAFRFGWFLSGLFVGRIYCIFSPHTVSMRLLLYDDMVGWECWSVRLGGWFVVIAQSCFEWVMVKELQSWVVL